MRERELLFDPGTEQRYSNTNGLLVGAVLEKVTGETLAALLDEKIVAPLGLESTYLYGAASRDRTRMPGFSTVPGWGLGPGLVNVSFADEALPDSADGSVVSTARDLLRYHQALRGSELLSESSWEEMRRVEPGLDNGLAYLVGESELGRFEGNVGRALGHSAVSYHHVRTGLYVVLLTNRGDGPLALSAFLERRYGREFLTGTPGASD
jgi:D-alanyl-D-alanine carboxypeptidase